MRFVRIGLSRLSGLVILLAAAGCGGGSGGGGQSAPVPQAVPKGFASVSFSITIPSRAQALHRRTAATPRHPSYVSSSTMSVVVTLDGTVVAPGYFNAVGPTINVTIPNVSTGAHTFQVDAHQGTNGTGAILSTATQPYTVLLDSNNPIALTLNGVVASVTLSVSNPTPAVASSGTAIAVSASALDAAGVPITGTYATPLALTSTDPVDFSISPTSLTQDISTATVNYSGLCKAPATIGVSNVGTVTPAVIGTNRQVLTSQLDTLTPGTLRYNLTNILTPGTIEVLPSAYVITVGSPLPAIPNGQTVCGAQRGVSALISGGGTSNIFTLAAGATVAINGMILNSASSAVNGAAISVPAGAIANLNNVIFTSNAATGGAMGGAISVVGTMTCITCTFNSNSAAGPQGGGAIYVAPNGTATIDNGLFNTNNATQGGAITVDKNATLNVVNTTGTTTFHGNTASGNGGAMSVVGGLSGGAIVTGASFTSNTAASNGGAVAEASSASGGASYTCTLCTFTGNTAHSGGAIFMPAALSPGSGTFDRSVFSNNVANGSPAYGGAISDGDYNLTVTNSAFIGNQTTGVSTDCGGGLTMTNHRGGVSIANSLFYNNSTAGNGGAICATVGSNGDTIGVSYSTIVGNSAAGAGGGSAWVNPNGGINFSASIVQGGVPQDFGSAGINNIGVITSSGYNLVGSTVCAVTPAGCSFVGSDVTGTTVFSPAAPSGAPVPYLAITTASAAYNIGIGCGAGTDVRGNPRPHLGPNCSAGEFEP